MKVFISWSGERSKAVGDLLDWWLQCVLQAVEPWMSSKDIDRGSLWFSEINKELKEMTIGIICLTNSNKDKPWILFEAGALAKGLTTNRVCTFLIDLTPVDIKDPLAQFNHTMPEKESLWGLVRTLNKELGEHQLKEKVLGKVFATYWPQFETEFMAIIKNTDDSEPVVKRNEQDILLELLSMSRSLDKRIRNLERKPRHESDYSIGSIENSAILNIDRSIQNLSEQGLDYHEILDILDENTNVSSEVIRNRINRHAEIIHGITDRI